jgi:cation/acetate symporter
VVLALAATAKKVWPGPDSEGGLFGSYDLANPGIVSIPLGFFACWLGTILSSKKGTAETTEREYHELYVRSETGLGAEKALAGH